MHMENWFRRFRGLLYAIVSWPIGVGALWQFVIVDSFGLFGGLVTHFLHMDWMTCAGGSFG